MAELIPLVALGGLYIIANHDKNSKENYTNMGKPANSLPNVNPPIQPVNYPIQSKVSDTNVNIYKNPNQTTDKYFNKNISKSVLQNNPPNSVGHSVQQTIGLTGEPINTNDFKHNNMVPFFGAKIKGSTADMNTSEGRLDNMQGAGSQYIRKTEQAPLFKPQSNMAWANGMPNMSEFYISRQNPSTRMANIKPWDEEKVAPGLGLGYNANSSGSGYNAGSEYRDAWLPKTVDELRVDTNPKVSYGLEGHQGPATSYIKEYGNVETQGRVEKNRPDTDYVVGPSRWFTTTGIEKAQTARGIEVLQHVNRPETSTSYYGTGGIDGKTTYVSGEYRDAHKQQLEAPDVMAPKSYAAPSTNDYGHGSYQKLCNNRSTVKQPTQVGAVESLVKAAVAPILDILRPTRKENVVGNLRPNGNAGTTVTAMPVFNPADRTKTTIKEQTIDKLGFNHLNLQSQQENAYLVSKQTPVYQERDTTNVSYSGNAAPANATATTSYESAYNQRNNPNKTHINRPNQGNMSMYNNSMNMTIGRRDEDRVNSRAYASSANITYTPGVETYGQINNMPQQYDNEKINDRINPDILKAFKENPYTKSLNSW